MREQGNSKILMIVVLVAAVLLGLYWFSGTVTQSTQNNDLTSIANGLDATDIDGPIDQSLSQNDADASSF